MSEIRFNPKRKNIDLDYKGKSETESLRKFWSCETLTPRTMKKECIDTDNSTMLIRFYHYALSNSLWFWNTDIKSKKDLEGAIQSYQLFHPRVVSSVKWKLYDLANNGDLLAMLFIIHDEYYTIMDIADDGQDINQYNDLINEYIDFSKMLVNREAEPYPAYLLGKFYYKGVGVEPNKYQALEYFYKSASTYLTFGIRERALKVCELMNEISQSHTLTQKINHLLYDKKLPSDQENTSISTGTGWVCSDGYIVTNYHVVEGHEDLYVVSETNKLKAEMVAKDKINDIVLLEVNHPDFSPNAIPISSQKAHVAQDIFTIGYPHPDMMGSSPKFSSGKINSLFGIGDDPRTFQISAPVQAGNSGCPLLNDKGEAIGIVTYKLDAATVFNWTGDLPQNVNYAIKIDYLKILLEAVASKDKRQVLPSGIADQASLYNRIKDSVFLISAE